MNAVTLRSFSFGLLLLLLSTHLIPAISLEPTHYEVLGVSRHASFAKIKTAYLEQAL